ncbi:hypothetical protein RYX36_031820 [Vicia faba]
MGSSHGKKQLHKKGSTLVLKLSVSCCLPMSCIPITNGKLNMGIRQVDGSVVSKQGFQFVFTDSLRIIYRLSGMGSAGEYILNNFNRMHSSYTQSLTKIYLYSRIIANCSIDFDFLLHLNNSY